jgi:hypothetical protein
MPASSAIFEINSALFIDEILNLTSQIYPVFNTEKIFFWTVQSRLGADYSNSGKLNQKRL